jgi:hypothetical protein
MIFFKITEMNGFEGLALRLGALEIEGMAHDGCFHMSDM